MCKQSSLTIASKIPSHLSGRLKWTCTDIFLDALASDQWGLGLRCSVLGCASHLEPIQSHIISGHHWGYSIHSGGYNIYYVGCTPPSDIPRNSWETWPFQLPLPKKRPVIAIQKYFVPPQERATRRAWWIKEFLMINKHRPRSVFRMFRTTCGASSWSSSKGGMKKHMAVAATPSNMYTM